MKKFLFLAILFWVACGEQSSRPLPIMGERTLEVKTVDGKTITDTIYATVPAFCFQNQDGDSLCSAQVKGKIYVADFFFISCPTICPIMKREMLRVYKAWKGDPEVMLISHTIDPEHDTLALLKQYCEDLGSDGKQWQFLTGNREQIYEMAEKGYYATAMPDSTEPGGFVHSGGFILVDQQGRVRGIYDGTKAEEADKLIEDIKLLKTE